jgi:hypothetical protein
MTPGKFDWFLHTMLFLQTQYVLKKIDNKASAASNDVEDDEGDDANNGDDSM